MNQALADKVAIITGASSGIGRATAELFASEGARVVLGARRKTALDEVVEAIHAKGGQAVAVAGDVRGLDYARQLVATATDTLGGLDIAVNNAAALGSFTPTADLEAADWQDVIETNLTGAFYAAKSQIPAMRERGGGSLIFVSSYVGYTVAFPGMAAYAASKAGVIGLVKTLAVELGQERIRANALLPGSTRTAMYETHATTDEERDALKALNALKRIASPKEIAHTALYLASDASSFTTGTAILVDGGLSVQR